MPPLSCFVAALGSFAAMCCRPRAMPTSFCRSMPPAPWSIAFALPPLWQAAGARRIAALAMAAFALVSCNRPQSYNYINGPVERAIDRYDPAARSIFIASTSVLQPFPLVVRRPLAVDVALSGPVADPLCVLPLVRRALPDDPVVRQALENTVSDLTAGQPAAVFISIRTDEGYVRGGQFLMISPSTARTPASLRSGRTTRRPGRWTASTSTPAPAADRRSGSGDFERNGSEAMLGLQRLQIGAPLGFEMLAGHVAGVHADRHHRLRQVVQAIARPRHPQIPVPVPVVGQGLIEFAETAMQRPPVRHSGDENGVVAFQRPGRGSEGIGQRLRPLSKTMVPSPK